MDAPAQKIVATGTDEATGYDSFRLGGFTFARDEYFAHIGWPKGSHIIEIDRFLRAMVRDIGWGFFYGWIFFDDIFGTTNHYGTVDIFAGSYDAGYKAQGIDYLETFPAEVVRRGVREDQPQLDQRGLRPAQRPARNRHADRAQGQGDRKANCCAASSPQTACSACRATRSCAPRTTAFRSTAPSPTWSSTSRRSNASRASRASSTRSTCSTTSPVPTSPGTRRSARSPAATSAA